MCEGVIVQETSLVSSSGDFHNTLADGVSCFRPEDVGVHFEPAAGFAGNDVADA